MDSTPFWRGLWLGFAIAAPVGPIGLLCIRRSLEGGAWLGLASGLGAATADAIYGSIAAFSLTVVAQVLANQRAWLHLLGGGYLIFLGLRTVFSRPAAPTAVPAARSLLAAYVSTLILTLSNPLTILSFAAIFAGLGLGASPDRSRAGILVLGIFTGSGLWWLWLSLATNFLRRRLVPAYLMWINRFSGLLIMGFGLVAFLGV